MPNRLLQPLIAIVYLLALWYVSVYMVFGSGLTSQSIAGVWIAILLIDITLTLNTVRLSDGISLRTRRVLLLEYLRKEIYLDLAMVVYNIVDNLNNGE